VDLPINQDEEFWQSAYQKHGSAILGFLKVRLFNQADAEDLLQETFVRAIRASDRIVDLARLRSFLFTIAHNLMVNRLRDQKKRAPGPDAGAPEALAAPEDGASPEIASQMNAFKRRLTMVLNDLSPNLRQAFELGVLQQEPYAEISKRTGWSLSAVKINVYRARKRVIEELGEFLPD